MTYPIFDLHCDTAYEMLMQKQRLSHNTLQLDLQRMEKAAAHIQVFASYVDQKNIKLTPKNHCLAQIQYLKEELHKNREQISEILSAKDLDRVVLHNSIGAILSIEGGEALEGSLDNLKMFFDLGVRLITLTWNWRNELADGILEQDGGGLTSFGKQAVCAMEDMGILVDVSHLSEKGFWDVASLCKKPFVASHSCVKALCNHKRNLSDEQMKHLIATNGGIGITFYPPFVKENGCCSVDDIVRHMTYVLSLGGADALGIGSDFDGVDLLPKDIEGVEHIDRLIFAMEKENFSETLIEKILFGNFHRIFRETLSEHR